MRFEPQPANPCFGCGGGNPCGLKLAFDADPEARRIIGRFRLGAEFQGGAGFIHGGIIATVLDEAMGKVCRLSDARAVTAKLTVEYLRPVRVDEEIHVQAFESERRDRQFYHQGEIRNRAGQLLARGRGRFVAVNPVRHSP